MSFPYIQQAYGVPANKGVRVEYTGGKEPRQGTITDVEGAHLMIRLDGDPDETGPYHPTWELRYLSAEVKPEGSNTTDNAIPF